ncbi:DUF4105 domain-containing protein [Bdellovibrio sp. HCB337]|uniref:DUF7844 domain-containing protein n=1 Tax=Bdellovibrio sp. HCB337 TaxID=3394358 RepID=UPI0039A6B8C6
MTFLSSFKKALLGVIGFAFLNQAHAFEYKLDGNVTPAQRQVLTQFFEKAKQTLPLKIKRQLPDIQVRFEKLTHNHGVIRGVTWGSQITLSNGLMNEIERGSERALGTFLHETVHVYDNLNLHTAEELSWIRKCKPQMTLDKKSNMPQKLPEGCKYYANMTTSFSGNPYFLQAAGWTGQEDNGFKDRSMNPYELTNPKETLAVNMDFFLTDPQFKCRRPTLYKIFAYYFEHIPFQDVNCDQALGFIVPSTPSSPAEVRAIDPSRVYQIHYLLADKGEEAMSGWGHSMIRLVICAPNTPVGPDCLLDVNHHLVLSFQAFINSMTMSTWAGLTGKYPSRLFMIPMHQVIEEYTKRELRSLKSLPLKLSRTEIRDFVIRTVETHWAYDGKYYFTKSNCATESLNLLKSVLLKPEVMAMEDRSPISLFDSLVRAGLGDPSVFTQKDQALEKGYLFESYEGTYQKAFALLQENLDVRVADFREFLKLSATERREMMGEVKKSHPERKRIAAAFLILESGAQVRLEAKMLGDLQKIVIEEMNKKKDSRAQVLVKNYQLLNQMFAKPASFLIKGTGYGVPTQSELAGAQAMMKSQVQRAEVLENETKASQNQLLSAKDLRESELLKENIKLLLKFMKAS